MSSVAPAAPGIAAMPAYHPAVTLIGRLLMAALFIIFGIRKVLAFGFYAGYFAKLGFPAPEVMVVLAIIVEVGGGLLLAIGWKTRWMAWALRTAIASTRSPSCIFRSSRLSITGKALAASGRSFSK